MNRDNCFLLLGRSGVGKSTLAKILSEDQSIIIGNALHSQTKRSICYDCKVNNFSFSIIDTQGYDDSNGNDQQNFGQIRELLTSNNFKIKGVILMLDFQAVRFGNSDKNGLNKIVSLIPMDNFWDYIILI